MKSEKIRLITTYEKILKPTAKEKKIGDNVIKNCMGVKNGDKVLIVTDTLRRGVANIFLESAKKFTDYARIIEMTPRKENGQEPPEEVAKAMLLADVLLFVTSKSLTHTQARREATKKGIRLASMPGITKEIALRTLGIDYTEVKSRTDKLAGLLTRGSKVELASPGGTRLVLNIEGKKCESDTGIFNKPGLWGNLPAGEAHLMPVEGSAYGAAVIDGCSFHSGQRLDKPIKLTINKGMVEKVEGGLAAKKLKEAFKKLGDGARNIAELGVGTNKAAKLSTSVLEAEKVWGTVHIGLGNNMSYGGTVSVPFHRDGVILKPEVRIDGISIPLV